MWNYSSEATQSTSRRVKGPTRSERQAGENYRGFLLIPARDGRVKMWDGREDSTYGPRWLPTCWSAETARAKADRMIQAAASIREHFGR